MGNAKAMSVREATRVLGVSRGLVDKAIRTGRIPAFRLGHKWLIPVVAIDRLLDEAGSSGPASQRNAA